MNTKFYKCCAVPLCKSTTISTPEKLFIHVPKNKQIRRRWLLHARRDPGGLSTKSTSYFCEDHFNLENDMENYVEYTTMGTVSQIRMKTGSVPTKFACQPKRTSSSSASDSCTLPAAKRQRRSLIKEYFEVEKIRAVETQQSESIAVLSISSDEQHESSPMKATKTSVSPSPLKMSKLKPFQDIDDRSNSDVSMYIPSIVISCLSESSSDTSSFNEPELKQHDANKLILKLTVDNIIKKSKFYIGVQKDCYSLVKTIHEHTGIPEHQILLCLKKIRLDTKFGELSDEFAISSSYASKIFTEKIPKLAEVMRPFIVKLDKSAIKSCLPIAFRKEYYNVTCIINCLEIEIQKPSKAIHQSLTWSDYKKANTMKYLISSTPNGLVNYISQGYGGRISNVCLVEKSDFLKCLPSGSLVMADRGFKHIEPLLLGVGCRLIHPPSVESGSKLSKEKVKETKQIASLRFHIENVIRRLREFSMLKPHACINNRLLGQLDDVIVIACGLINLQDSLINK